jgi:hypothetical protein
MGARVYQGGTTMRNLAAGLVLLCMVNVGRAGEKEIFDRLVVAGFRPVSPGVGDEEDMVGVALGRDDAHPDFNELCELRHLRAMYLLSRGVSDSDMRVVGNLTGLRKLVLNDSAVTDVHLKQVGRLRTLRVLSLTSTRVTDAGLEELAGLTDLKELWLDGTGVTEEGVARLQKALPRCQIIR